MEPLVTNLLTKFPGRKSQIQQLYNLFGYEDEPFVDAVYIQGGPSTGKSSILAELLTSLEIKHAVVNLIECYTAKILFESILNKLANHKVDPRKAQPYAKCDNFMEFIFNLQKCSTNIDLLDSVIVLDKAEQLRNMDFNLLAGFLRLKELSKLNITVVFVSQIIFQKYYMKGNIVEPLKIYFSQYSKDELMNILVLDFCYAKQMVLKNYTEEIIIDVDFYSNYLNVFMSVFYRACRDLSELRYMARLNFLQYCQPVLKKECAVTDSMALWRHIAPILKTSLEVLYLRLSTSSQDKAVIDTNQFAFSKKNLASSLELPFYAKYILIAAYLASYNPSKDDKRIFMKFHGKKNKTMKDVKAKSKVSEQLNTQKGPKPFSFDRLLAIFYAIIDIKVGFNNNLLVQVSSLVELQLLTALSDSYNLDGQKYKCAVSFDFIQTISKMVGFNIRKYLSDFSYM